MLSPVTSFPLMMSSPLSDVSTAPGSSAEGAASREAAGAAAGAEARGGLEEPLPSTSSEEEDPLAGGCPQGVPKPMGGSPKSWGGL